MTTENPDLKGTVQILPPSLIPDCPVELAGPLEGVPLLPQGRLVLPEVADVPDEAGLDVLVVEELREDDELLAQELQWDEFCVGNVTKQVINKPNSKLISPNLPRVLC